MLADKNTLKLLRIPFSFYLMPLFLLALSQAPVILWFNVLISFAIIHFLVYPASNGYNSYVDRDEGSIGGLENPPPPTRQLFYVTLVLDALAICLAFIFLTPLFGLCLIIYIAASRAYSSRQVRLKKYPFIGFLTVIIFQGMFTYYTSACGITGQALLLNKTNLYILLGASFQIAGAYPLTQIYQHQQDLKDGVVTLSYKLGYRGTFLFTASMFLLCNLFYFLYFAAKQQVLQFYIIQLFFLPIILYFTYWFYKVFKNTAHANFKNTMRMNTVAAFSMSLCFTVLFIINHLL